MTRVVSLCPACSQCPTIEIDAHEVRIGEGSCSTNGAAGVRGRVSLCEDGPIADDPAARGVPPLRTGATSDGPSPCCPGGRRIAEGVRPWCNCRAT